MEASTLFAAIVQDSDAAIIAKDADGTVLSWNRAAETIFGWTAAEMIGQSIDRIVPPERLDESAAVLDTIKRGDSAARIETVRLHKDGSPVDIALLVSALRGADGAFIGSSEISRDITSELRTRSALSDVEARFGLVADNIAQLVWIADPDGWIFWYNKRWFEYTDTTIDQMQGFGWRSVHHPDHVDRVTEQYTRNIASGEEWEDTFPLRDHDGNYRWFLTRGVPLLGDDGKVQYWFGTNTDVTALRDAERRIEVLLMEVNHRSKNLLSVVQSMARRSSANGDDFIPRLERRIAALSANQDVLVHRNWTAVPLRELIEAQLLFLDQAASQTELAGPDVVIQPNTAEALSMTLHELATNAEKYGAYSASAGIVRISWDISGTDSDAEFVLRWTESGGPGVLQTNEPGFGSRIIQDVPRGRLRGQVETEYAPQGFRFTLRCPAVNVLAAPE